MSITIDKDGTVAALEMRERGGIGRWQPLNDVVAPPAWLVAEHVEQWQLERRRSAQWTLVRARWRASDLDHVLIEVTAGDGDAGENMVGATAVLPRCLMAAGDLWADGSPERWVAVQRHFPEQIDGAEKWRSIPAAWLASRTEAVLVARVAQFYLEVPFSFEAAMHGDSAMLICPAGSEIGRIVGDNGMVVSQLKGLLGLRRLSVVRLSASQEPLGRLRSAVQHVTGLSNMQFFIQSAAAQKQLPNGEPPLPAVLVKKKDVAKFVGKNGSNLYFIRRLSGVSFRHLDVQEQVVFARNEELRARKRTRMQQKQQEAEEAMRAAREAVDEARCEGVVTPKRTGTDDVRS